MAYPTSTRTGHRFLGNRHKTEVHDLTKEDTSKSGCQIDEVLNAGHGMYFTPDTLEQSEKEGYDPCAKCIGGSRR